MWPEYHGLFRPTLVRLHNSRVVEWDLRMLLGNLVRMQAVMHMLRNHCGFDRLTRKFSGSVPLYSDLLKPPFSIGSDTQNAPTKYSHQPNIWLCSVSQPYNEISKWTIPECGIQFTGDFLTIFSVCMLGYPLSRILLIRIAILMITCGSTWKTFLPLRVLILWRSALVALKCKPLAGIIGEKWVWSVK